MSTDLSKELLCVSVGQRTAKLQIVKVGDLKKSCSSARVEPNEGSPSSSSGQLDHLKSLTDHNFAAL